MQRIVPHGNEHAPVLRMNLEILRAVDRSRAGLQCRFPRVGERVRGRGKQNPPAGGEIRGIKTTAFEDGEIRCAVTRIEQLAIG